MLYNFFLLPRGVCHTATAVAVIVYVCTTNLRCLLITFMVYSRVTVCDDIETKWQIRVFSTDLDLSNQYQNKEKKKLNSKFRIQYWITTCFQLISQRISQEQRGDPLSQQGVESLREGVRAIPPPPQKKYPPWGHSKVFQQPILVLKK